MPEETGQLAKVAEDAEVRFRASLDKDRVERIATAFLTVGPRSRGVVGHAALLDAVQRAETLVALIDSRGYAASALESFQAGMERAMRDAQAAADVAAGMPAGRVSQ